MASGNLRALSFRTSAGEIVRVHDCVCWRHLEGRPCRTAQERQAAEAIDVVIIPVLPSGYGSSKRPRKVGPPPPSTCAPTSPPAPVNAPPNQSQFLAGDGNGNGGDGSPGIHRDGLLHSCAAAQAALEAGGVRATVDDCPRQTPGAKYHAWENRGVGLRVEVGSREAASATFSLALHPRLAHLMPLAAAAAAAAAPAPEAASAAGQGSPDGMVAAAGVRPGGRATMRLGGLTAEQLVPACRAVLHHGPATAAAAAAQGGGGGTLAAAAAAGAAACMVTEVAAAAAGGSRWCRKLHLWPELVAAWGSTESAVAALLAELAAAAAAAARAGGGGGGGEGAAAAGGAEVASTAADCGGGGGGSGGEAPPGGGVRPYADAGGTGGGVRPTGQRPCVAHLRHLLHLGRRCYCGRGHCSLQQLQAEVERRLQEGPGGGGGGGAGQLQQQQQQAVTGVVGVDWLVPQQPIVGQQQQQEGKGLRGGDRGPPREGRKAPVMAPLKEEEEEEEEEMDGGQAGFDGRSVTDGGGDSNDGDGGGGGRVVLLVGNIPSAVRASVVQGELATAFAPFGCCGVGVSRTRSGGSHGWARLSLAGATAEATAAAATAAVAALDGRLRLGGAPLTVSYSSGRLDTIFPYLPYIVRSAMRVDSTAAFSATDQATADKMTDLLALLAERLMTDPPQPPPPLREAAGSRRGPQPQPETGRTTVAAAPEAVPPPQLPLLPLVLTDGTACCGGNSLSFARRFGRVVAVELDRDRADDLRHNEALVRAWDHFRRRAAAGPQQCTPPPGSRGTASHTAELPAHRLEKGEVRELPSSPAGCPAAAGGLLAAAGNCNATDGTNGVNGGAAAAAATSSADGGGGLLEVVGGVEGGGGLGELEVVCGDYTQLMRSLRQDVVFLDPPWGGPQYCGAAGAAAAGAAARPAGGGGATGQPASAATRSGDGAMEYGDTAFMLGNEPLSYMVSELLVNGAAGMVAVKLPSRADMELRAMQARVRQRVANGMLRDKGGGARGGGGEAGVASAGVGGTSHPTSHPTSRPTCRPKLVGAEVTLGRSALVIFMLLPYKYSSRGPGANGAPAACGGSGGGAALEASGLSGAVAAAAAAAAGGDVASQEDAVDGVLVDNGGRAAAVAALDSNGEEGDDDTDDEEDDGRESVRGGCGSYDDGGGGGSGATAGALRRAAARGGCPACEGLGTVFRAALRDCCSRLGLSYRLVCK